MCFDPVSIGVALVGTALTTAAGLVGGYYQNQEQNNAAQYAYEQERAQQEQLARYEQEMARRREAAYRERHDQVLSRNRINAKQSALQNFSEAQGRTLENRRRQAAALANASSSGITGAALDLLSGDYERAVGNVSNNLQTTYNQINQRLFFEAEDSRRETQSAINQNVPQPRFVSKPYQTKFNPWPTLLGGAAQFATSAAGAWRGTGGAAAASSMPQTGTGLTAPTFEPLTLDDPWNGAWSW